MEKGIREIGYPGSRHVDLKRSFKLGLHGLLTTCSKEVIIFSINLCSSICYRIGLEYALRSNGICLEFDIDFYLDDYM
ncbi:hypothetical protein L6452_43651 [Arctium lappa]|uniref:Uncharacterized protein n=1 Tax=Arctium lappa TaxID=4217 RepID=A0ACB8XHF8_ARCLA|nr:hypothetical protein L6452_43651 [Arctium lappa]